MTTTAADKTLLSSRCWNEKSGAVTFTPAKLSLGDSLPIWSELSEVKRKNRFGLSVSFEARDS